LYYNRFRYYDPDSGSYLSQDPIGLAGGNPTIYGYVHDTNSWIDVFGLSKYNPTEVLGRKVYQNTTDFVTGTPDFVDPSVHPSIKAKIDAGATNLDLMKAGNAPIGVDGKPINLHHVLGQEPGAMVEIKQSTHQRYHKQLHGLIENGRSFRNNPDLAKSYKNFRTNYWKERAKQIEANKLKCH
jgi:uncharacterized protein RhaS with RHS repeats